MQRTLVLLKPDAVQRGLVGELVSRIEHKGFKLVAMKLMLVDDDLAVRHYAEHADKPFFGVLRVFVTSSPLVAIVVEGEEAVAAVRVLMGETDPLDAAPGTIRGDYAVSIGLNLMHGSDSIEAAEREIPLFFSEDELLASERDIDRWITES